MSPVRSYSELESLETFEERFNYLSLKEAIGRTTFGYDRYLNQRFYSSREWKRIRTEVIVRDESSDLAMRDRPIFKGVLIHHMNPLSLEDFDEQSDFLLNPEYLICVSFDTHRGIHFGSGNLSKPIERRKGDTTPWRTF